MAASRFDWTKAELIEKIRIKAHKMIILGINEEGCYSEEHTSRSGKN